MLLWSGNSGPRRNATLIDSFACCFPVVSTSYGDLRAIMNSVFSLIGAAHRYCRKDSVAEIRAGKRKNVLH